MERNLDQEEGLVTGRTSGVLMTPGATQLVRMLSFAHSHARLLVSWFIAPEEEEEEEGEG